MELASVACCSTLESVIADEDDCSSMIVWWIVANELHEKHLPVGLTNILDWSSRVAKFRLSCVLAMAVCVVGSTANLGCSPLHPVG